MMDFDDSQGVELHHQGDLPARSGMGSSSAFANGLILALSTLKGTSINKFELFAKAIELEQSWIKDNVGSQDQVATAVGGFNLIQFQQDGGIAVSPVAANRQTFSNLNDRLMLFYTGGTRTASVVVESFVSNLHERKVQLNRMRDMAFEARRILVDETDLDGFGELLDEGWRLKRQLGSRISTDVIDDVYSRARAAGALGGKLLGAGGAGFMLLYVRPENQPEVRSALSSLIHVPFRFETEGATLLMRSGGAEVD
jgi:D-glycero-alpha-D-manno-heptose-7-phosphate kinase